ncbi:uncharacterized protein LOC123469724 [Daphnia magna]|uniref:uncharacterized protein LOC123469724 n=1 Tax=Daphnia magna TaxID=35525 RepID=UPI001E1BA883|nr:uncharacterized protein LOC123469724 [Daphnia magna]
MWSAPLGKKKDVGHIKKKWNNLMRETRAEIAKHNSSIRGTGGGPQYRLKHIDEKIRDQVIGINNPSLPGHVILGGVESETAPSEVDNHDLGAVEILDDTHYTIAIEFKQEQSLGQESCSAATPRPIPTLSEAPPPQKKHLAKLPLHRSDFFAK